MRIANDLKSFLQEHLDDMAESHLDCWQERYYRKSKAQIEFDLDINYDFSADIEYVEQELKRELTDSEKEYFITKYERAIIDNFYRN